MHNYLRPLIEILNENRNDKNAGPMKKYVKDRYDYLGIKTPERRELVKAFLKEQGLPEISDFNNIIKDLWSLDEREFQYIGNTLADRMKKKVPSDTIETYKHMIITKSWWDTVDLTAGKIVGYHFQAYEDVKESYLPRFRNSDNMWLRRTALLYQLHYKDKTDWELLKEIISENLGSKEFFINKAIGWILREYSKTAPEEVRDFIDRTDLAPLSRREGLKWMNSRS